MSRTALYSAIRPHPAGGPCPECGELLVFTNRSNRLLGRATCQACGVHSTLPKIDNVAPPPPPEVAAGGAPTRAAAQSADGGEAGTIVGIPTDRAAVIGGAAVLGAALGAAAVKMIRGR